MDPQAAFTSASPARTGYTAEQLEQRAAELRKRFPIFQREVRPGVPLVYLDSAATSLKPETVIDALAEHYRLRSANVHRGIYTIAEEATAAYEAAREKVARFINAPSTAQVIFTHGTTESINLVAWSWGGTHLKPGDEVLVTQMEHHANLVPWQQVCRRMGATLKFVPLTDDGELDLAAFRKLLSERTRLVAVTGASNVLGTVPPVSEIVRLAHEVGARVLVDGAQSVPHRGCDVQALDCDFLAFSGHKMCGPEGVGVLYGKLELLEAMPPMLTGGEMVKKVTFEEARWNDLPWKFEAGTPPVAPAVALGAAVDFLREVGWEFIRAHEQALVQYAFDRLQEVPGIRLLGPPPPKRSGLVAFTLEGIHPHDVAQFLDRYGVAVRAGHHCAQPLHQLLGLRASTRASFYLYNVRADIDVLVNALKQTVERFARFRQRISQRG